MWEVFHASTKTFFEYWYRLHGFCQCWIEATNSRNITMNDHCMPLSIWVIWSSRSRQRRQVDVQGWLKKPLHLIVANHLDLYLPLVEDTRTTRSVSMKIRTTVYKHSMTCHGDWNRWNACDATRPREVVWAQDLLRGVRVSCINDDDFNMLCQP